MARAGYIARNEDREMQMSNTPRATVAGGAQVTDIHTDHKAGTCGLNVLPDHFPAHSSSVSTRQEYLHQERSQK